MAMLRVYNYLVEVVSRVLERFGVSLGITGNPINRKYVMRNFPTRLKTAESWGEVARDLGVAKTFWWSFGRLWLGTFAVGIGVTVGMFFLADDPAVFWLGTILGCAFAGIFLGMAVVGNVRKAVSWLNDFRVFFGGLMGLLVVGAARGWRHVSADDLRALGSVGQRLYSCEWAPTAVRMASRWGYRLALSMVAGLWPHVARYAEIELGGKSGLRHDKFPFGSVVHLAMWVLWLTSKEGRTAAKSDFREVCTLMVSDPERFKALMETAGEFLLLGVGGKHFSSDKVVDHPGGGLIDEIIRVGSKAAGQDVPPSELVETCGNYVVALMGFARIALLDELSLGTIDNREGLMRKLELEEAKIRAAFGEEVLEALRYPFGRSLGWTWPEHTVV